VRTDLRRRAAVVITIVIFGLLVKVIWDKVSLVIWSNVPWWMLILLLVVAYFVIEAVVKRLLAEPRRPRR
jgi:hypothetical protein